MPPRPVMLVILDGFGWREATADNAVRLARMRYNAGYTSYLEVLTNDANLYNSQLTLESAQQQEALSLVQLYNALGGGW